MIAGKKMLVVSAHAADYVWRAGGTIAKYIKGGAEVHVVVLSFGSLYLLGAVREALDAVLKNEP